MEEGSQRRLGIPQIPRPEYAAPAFEKGLFPAAVGKEGRLRPPSGRRGRLWTRRGGRAARPGRGRGGRSDAAGGGEGPEGCRRRADREEGRAMGPRCASRGSGHRRESAAGPESLVGSNPAAPSAPPVLVRGVHPRLEVSTLAGGLIESTAGDGDAGE